MKVKKLFKNEAKEATLFNTASFHDYFVKDYKRDKKAAAENEDDPEAQLEYIVSSVPFWISKVLEPLAKAAFDAVAADIKQDYPAFDAKKAWNDIKKSVSERAGAYEDM
jgi:hypothetical protein